MKIEEIIKIISDMPTRGYDRTLIHKQLLLDKINKKRVLYESKNNKGSTSPNPRVSKNDSKNKENTKTGK